jgi:hypothetical protein
MGRDVFLYIWVRSIVILHRSLKPRDDEFESLRTHQLHYEASSQLDKIRRSEYCGNAGASPAQLDEDCPLTVGIFRLGVKADMSNRGCGGREMKVEYE